MFSGRRDPTWQIGEDLALELKDIWDSLEPSTQPVSAPPALGYRGCFLRGTGGGEWLVHAGVVTRRTAGGTECRRDPDRTFEKRLLASAPRGMIPDDIEVY